MIEAFPAQEDELVYVLMDSWYTSEKVINACNRKGFHVIAAVKAKRLIYPEGIGIAISDFAVQYIRKSDLRSVTVEGQDSYWVYEYEGPLSEMENVKVLLSWKDYTAYHVRWNIETGYRYFKELLGFDQYQLLSFHGIQRFWAIQFLTHTFLECQRHEWSTEELQMTLGDVVYRIRQEMLGQIIVYVYERALQQKPLFDILQQLQIPA